MSLSEIDLLMRSAELDIYEDGRRAGIGSATAAGAPPSPRTLAETLRARLDEPVTISQIPLTANTGAVGRD